jgi:hypothetical protein
MSDKDIIDQLTRDVAYLKSELDKLPDVLKALREVITFDFKDTSKHIVFIYDCINTLSDRLTPLERELFPNVIIAREQLGSIIEKLKRDAERNEKKS